MTLNDVWFFLFILIIAGYLILDGFDMGVGILLLPLARTDIERRTFLNSIGPVWDGNEVWLVLGGGVLFAVFPLAYASLFSGMYIPFMLVLLVLILRTVALEFRSKEPGRRWRSTWDAVFAVASLGLAFLLGVAFGNIVSGLPLDAHGQHLDRVDRIANAVRAPGRGHDGRDVRGAGRDLPADQDRRRAARPARTRGAAADDRVLPAEYARRRSPWRCSTRTSRTCTSTTSGRPSSRPRRSSPSAGRGDGPAREAFRPSCARPR